MKSHYTSVGENIGHNLSFPIGSELVLLSPWGQSLPGG